MAAVFLDEAAIAGRGVFEGTDARTWETGTRNGGIQTMLSNEFDSLVAGRLRALGRVPSAEVSR